MTTAELKAVIVEGLRQVAPESDPASLGPDQPVRETLGIDSYDFLQFLVGLHKRLGVEVPEADYGRLNTVNGMIAYLQPKL